MATWAVKKVLVDRDASPPEDPMTRLAAELQVIANAGGTIVGVQQDVTDGSWVIYYYTA